MWLNRLGLKLNQINSIVLEPGLEHHIFNFKIKMFVDR